MGEGASFRTEGRRRKVAEPRLKAGQMRQRLGSFIDLQ